MTRRIVIGTVIVAIAMAVTGVVAFAYVDRAVRTEAQNELFRQAEATGALIEAELDGVDLTPRARIETQLRNVRVETMRVLERARVVGGHEIVEAAFVIQGRTFPLSTTQELISLLPPALAERDVVTVDVDGTEMFATVQRIPLAKGEVVVAIGRTAPLLPLRQLNRALLIAVTVGVILIVILGTGMARRIGRRLEGLEDASRRIAEGDLSARAPIEGSDEIAAVATSFNDMAENLERTRRREREFLMSVGHDLRTPLTTIRGYAEALDAGDVGDDDTGRVAGILHAQTDRLSRLVDDIMLLARIEAKEFTLEPERIDVGAHLSEIVQAFEQRAATLGVAIAYEGRDGCVATLDPDRLAQVCSNLIENALRYTPEDGDVTVEVGCDGAEVWLDVSDTGPGIAAADLEHVFDRLFVAQRYRPVRPEGSGLGLAIVGELVDAMGGTAAVASEPGEGSRFTVRFPR